MSIRYGFFHAIRSLNSDNEYEYDRAYTADDHNEYLNGLISRNGVFKNYQDQFLITFEEHNDDSITFIDPDTGTETTYNGYIAVSVGRGKALVNGHWVINDSPELLYLHKRDIVAKRIDMISLRWRMDQRDVILVATEGTPNSGASIPNNVGIPDQLGYTRNVDDYITTDSHFEPVESITYGSTVEICLGLIEIPARNSNDLPRVQMTTGESRCPWIAHMLYRSDEARENAESFIDQYTDVIKNWWEQIQEEGDMKANLTTVRYKISGSPSEHTNTIFFSEIPDYEYQVEDTVNVYYNGLYMDEGSDYEILVNDNQDYYIVLKNINMISGKNSLSIEIYKGTALALPDASNIKY